MALASLIYTYHRLFIFFIFCLFPLIVKNITTAKKVQKKMRAIFTAVTALKVALTHLHKLPLLCVCVCVTENQRLSITLGYSFDIFVVDDTVTR